MGQQLQCHNPLYYCVYSAAAVFTMAVFGEGNGSIVLDDVTCMGDERRLLDCHHSAQQHDCEHNEDVGVRCMDRRKTVLLKL